MNNEEKIVKRLKKIADLINKHNINIIRPGLGLPPKNYDNIIGRKLKCDVTK